MILLHMLKPGAVLPTCQKALWPPRLPWHHLFHKYTHTHLFISLPSYISQAHICIYTIYIYVHK
uniref:Uncharacterized protein n=1 Tax=Oryzias latipes TaxID=8090 RepID=A0A3P9JY21_ORYLA